MLTKEEYFEDFNKLMMCATNEHQSLGYGDDKYNYFKNIFIDLINDYFEMIGKLETGELSDGYHTFNELYYHRAVLFSVICNQNKDLAWKSKLHSDGTMYDGMFIVGINTPLGQYSYHYNLDMWDLFNVTELANAPKWDGHEPKDVIRLKSLNGDDTLLKIVLMK